MAQGNTQWLVLLQCDCTHGICSPALGAQSSPSFEGRRGQAAKCTSKRKTKKSTRWPKVCTCYF